MDSTKFNLVGSGKNANVKKKKVSAVVRLPTSIVHPLTGESRLLMDHHDRLRFFMGVVRGWGFPKKRELYSSEQLKTARSLARELFGGTQQPEIIVASDFTLIVGVTGVLAPAIAYKWGSAIDQGSWAQVFDEVKVSVGKFEIYPIFSSQATDLMVFCIDYDDATVLASSAAALAYDTRQLFNGANQPNVVALSTSKVTCPVIPMGTPDRNWIDTTDTSTIVAYLKGYGATTTTAATYKTFFLMKVKFRQVN